MDALNSFPWLLVIFFMVAWSYPLSVICRRAGRSPAIGWIAGTVGLPLLGPLWCVWWLALARWGARLA
jgi:hypothetical protein